MFKLIYPEDGSMISLMTDYQKEFERRERIKYPTDEERYSWLDESFAYQRDLTDPVRVIFRWENDDPLSPVRFELATDPDFEADIRHGLIGSYSGIFPTDDRGGYAACVDNLLTGTKYYWRVGDGKKYSETRSFSTVPGEIRRIRCGSYGNVRDFGGKVTADGKMVKQGLLYRGTMLEQHGDDRSSILPETLQIMGKKMKVKTEIDFRHEVAGVSDKSCLGENANYHLIPIGSYSDALSDSGKEMLKQIFDILEKEENYPIYIHCVAGADRTGTVAMLINAVLGLSMEDIIIDYDLSELNKCFPARHWQDSGELVTFRRMLAERYPDAEYPDVFLMLLRDAGVSEESFDRIRSILLV